MERKREAEAKREERDEKWLATQETVSPGGMAASTLREGRGEERRARLSRHVGVRDAYKGAFMNRVFPSFDGSLAVHN